MLASVPPVVEKFALAFVPLFFAVDAVGVLPLYLGLTEGIEPALRRRVLWESMATAIGVALGFVLFGQTVFRLLGVTIDDFMLAGGVLVFVLATMDMVVGDKPARQPVGLGAVPLGTPLIAGPAVLAMCLILVNEHGWLPTVAAVVANVLLAGALFSLAGWIARRLGKTGVRVASKVSSLLLAAFAVMMVRRGLTQIVSRAIDAAAWQNPPPG